MLDQIKGFCNINLSELFDKLSSQLKNLESLNLQINNYSLLLVPLIESCLPVETLKHWNRLKTSNLTNSQENLNINSLDSLMSFLQAEVDSEARILMSKEGFDTQESTASSLFTHKKLTTEKRATSVYPAKVESRETEVGKLCLFCSKKHASQDCFKAQRRPYEEKKQVLVEKRACLICFKIGHIAKFCKTRLQCPVCKRRHYVVMCQNINNQAEKSTPESEPVKTPTCYSSKANNILLQTLQVMAKCGNFTKKLRILLDSGSQFSYIAKGTASELKLLPVGYKNMVHCLFGGTETALTNHEEYLVTLQNLQNDYNFEFRVFSQDKICSQIPRIQTLHSLPNNEISKMLCDVGSGTPDIEILLGADSIVHIMTNNIKPLNDNLVAIETLLGWCVMGTSATLLNVPVTEVTSMFCLPDLWELDILGIENPKHIVNNDEKEYMKEFFQSTVKLDDYGRYTVMLPWKQNHMDLFENNNRVIAEKRLFSVYKRLEKLNQVEAYEKVFEKWINDDIIEEVPSQELNNKQKFYLPHHPVFKNSSTSPIRPVFDGACKETGKLSINECLLKGENLLNLLPVILTKFRFKRYAVSSDIKMAFLMIGINIEDRDKLRFLMYNNSEMKEFRHKRLVFGLISSPFLLQATIQYHLENHKEDFVENIKQGFYVDNFLMSVDSEAELNNLVTFIWKIMAKGKFELRQWCSNGNLTAASADLEKETQLDIIDNKVINLLGILWDVENDNLGILCSNINKFLKTEFLTKRIVLSISSRIFDPVGVTAPLMITPKLILRKLWEEKVPWDAKIPEVYEKQFRSWMNELTILENVEIPRWLYFTPSSKCSLHVFNDSSGVAMGSVIFLRSEFNNQVHVNLVMVKSRLCPINLSIPKLELLACNLGLRLYNTLKDIFNNIPVIFWTDSMVALSWIKKEEKWKQFVNNRVKEILSYSTKEQWRFVPGEKNPADTASRQCSPSQLYRSKYWEGPPWLKLQPDQWECSENIQTDVPQVYEEKCIQKNQILLVSTNENLFNDVFKKYSSFSKIVRIVGYVIRFIKKCKNKLTGNASNLDVVSRTEELENAKMIIFKIIQEESYNSEEKLFTNLKVFKDKNGILRLKTKLILSNLDDTFKTPLLLPGNNEIVQKMIREQHIINSHVGANTLRTILRENYFIVQAKKVCRQIVTKCVVCRKFMARACQVEEAPLPADRVNLGACFETTGIDLAGPMYLKDGSKTWIVLFTCCVYRAVHLELVLSLSTEALIMAIRRFIARKGRIRVFRSDNGTNFIGAENLLKEIDWQRISEFSSASQITWKRQPPGAPWYGGFFERLIGVVKDLLRKNLGKAVLNYEELYTILCDVEYLVNSRPLTYVYENAEELQPITPLHFIQDIKTGEVPDLDYIDSNSVNIRFNYLQKLRELLRSRFRKEYLAELTQFRNNKNRGSIKKGDVVLIENDKKRIHWPLGKIIEVFPGKDGNERIARIKVSDGEIVRPFQRLYNLEIAHMREEPLEESIRCETPVQVNEKTEPINLPPPPPPTPSPTISSRGRTIKVPQKLDL